MPVALPTRIKKLYRDGWSVEAIASQFHTKPNTVTRFISKNKFSNNSLGYIKSCERKRKSLINFDQVIVTEISESQARLYAAILYWCEGSKYPASTSLSFTTSDIQMQRLFINLIRKGFGPIESKFRIWLQFHTDQDKNKLYRYWSTTLRVPVSQFIKPSVTDKKGGRYRRIYYGTCSLRYSDYSLILRLMGIYQKFYKQALRSLV